MQRINERKVGHKLCMNKLQEIRILWTIKLIKYIIAWHNFGTHPYDETILLAPSPLFPQRHRTTRVGYKNNVTSIQFLRNSQWYILTQFPDVFLAAEKNTTKARLLNIFIILSNCRKTEKHLPITRHMWALIPFRKQLFKCFVILFIIFVATHIMNLCIDRHFDTLTVHCFLIKLSKTRSMQWS